MNSSLNLVMAAISGAVIILFFLFWINSNRVSRLSKKHLLKQIQNPNSSAEEKQKAEQALLKILKNKTSISWKGFIAMSVILIVSSWLSYLKMGEPEYDTKAQPAPEMSLEQAITELQQRLINEPDNLEGHMLLARSLMTIKDFESAVSTYRKAYELNSQDSVIMTELAEAIALHNNTGSFLGEPEELLKKAVEASSSNQKALWLYGMTFYERGDLEKTEQLWTQLYDIMENEGAKAQVKQQLTELRAKIGKTDPLEETQTALIQVTVDLTEELKAQAPATAILFVSVKEPGGMPMPIAAKRMRLTEVTFPLQLSLSDRDNLQTQRKLSGFEKVNVQARISLSGVANSSPGDMESEELTVDIGATESVQLMINTTLK